MVAFTASFFFATVFALNAEFAFEVSHTIALFGVKNRLEVGVEAVEVIR
jgi:hypothetical protein